MAATKERTAAQAPTMWIEADFGDAELTLREFPDGMFELRIDAGNRLLLNVEQMQQLADDVVIFAKTKGWA